MCVSGARVIAKAVRVMDRQQKVNVYNHIKGVVYKMIEYYLTYIQWRGFNIINERKYSGSFGRN